MKPILILMLLIAAPCTSTGALLSTSPEGYLSQAARVRQANDRPWAPQAGQLGNLRHLQITAADCVVRVVSGSENRVFAGTRDVMVVEQSRVLDADPNERPAPRDVVLAPDRAQACPGIGSCGVSVTSVGRSSGDGEAGRACFTVQLATAHELLLGGDGLSLLVDRLAQPALRIRLNPSSRMQVWLEQVDIGLLSIDANAAASIGGSGRADFLGGSSSNSASVMYLHGIDANQVGVSATTTGTRWSIRIGAETKAAYQQPARAPGAIAKNYGIEIDGALERLEVPVGRVDPHPLSDATRSAARTLRQQVLARAGPAPSLPPSDPTWPSAKQAAASLRGDAHERVAQVVARYLPASIRITRVALWKQGGRLEGIAPDAAAVRDVVRLLERSGEFTYVSGGGGIPRDGGQAFSTQLNFSCDAPGEASICPAGDPTLPGAYSAAQVRATLEMLLGSGVTIGDVRLNEGVIALKARAPNEREARTALDRLAQQPGFMRLSTSTFAPSASASSIDIDATLRLVCAVPPKPDGICTPQGESPR